VTIATPPDDTTTSEAFYGSYVSGERGWVKVKNREYWRYEMEREGAMKTRRPRQFV
jgi:hypothetical protein